MHTTRLAIHRGVSSLSRMMFDESLSLSLFPFLSLSLLTGRPSAVLYHHHFHRRRHHHTNTNNNNNKNTLGHKPCYGHRPNNTPPRLF